MAGQSRVLLDLRHYLASDVFACLDLLQAVCKVYQRTPFHDDLRYDRRHRAGLYHFVSDSDGSGQKHSRCKRNGGKGRGIQAPVRSGSALSGSAWQHDQEILHTGSWHLLCRQRRHYVGAYAPVPDHGAAFSGVDAGFHPDRDPLGHHFVHQAVFGI